MLHRPVTIAPMSQALVRITPDEFEFAVSRALACPPDFAPGGQRAVASFLASARHAMQMWVGYRTGPQHSPTALTLGLLLNGRTVLVLPAPMPQFRFDANATAATLRAVLEELDGQAHTYAQCILGEGCEQIADVARSAGFARLTGLRYLDRDSRYPWVEPPSDGLSWVEYSAARHAEFRNAVAETYVDTQDCPELVGLREMDDVLAAHRGAGPFNPALWNLLISGGKPAGVLLCANHGQTLEIVYVGVAPEFRRKGFGCALLRRAIAHARCEHAARILVAVDERNEPAIRSYSRFNFEDLAQRDVFLRAHPSRSTMLS